MRFVAVNDTGKIVRTGSCPSHDIDKQGRPGQQIIPVPNEDHRIIKPDTHCYDFSKRDFVELTESERADWIYEKRKKIPPTFAGDETDAEIDAKILDHYAGKVDPTTWRRDNYTILRRAFYPRVEEFIDAQIKRESGDSKLQQDGNTQLARYTTTCLDVKSRFPKPVRLEK